MNYWQDIIWVAGTRTVPWNWLGTFVGLASWGRVGCGLVGRHRRKSLQEVHLAGCAPFAPPGQAVKVSLVALRASRSLDTQNWMVGGDGTSCRARVRLEYRGRCPSGEPTARGESRQGLLEMPAGLPS